jgi:integrase/recombinase XerD
MRDVRTVFFYGPQAVAEGVHGAFLNTPFVIDEDGQPDFKINEYLLARRNGDWVGGNRIGGRDAEVQGRRTLRASEIYLRTRVYQLDSFRRWCREQGVRPVVFDEQSLDLYAEDLEEGLVTGFEGGVLPQTVNQHLTSIIDFLQFATARGWRERVGLTLKKRVTGKGRHESGSGYLLMRRVNPSELEIWYTEADIQAFIGEFDTATGKLAAKIMFATGLRMAEALCLKVTDIPTVEQFRADKAKRYLHVIGKFDKPRRVALTEEIVRDMQKFVAFERRRYAAKLTGPTERLLIGPTLDGKTAPIKPRALQKEFKKAREAAQKSALSPHLLRHHYAAHYLLRAWRTKVALMGQALTSFEVSVAEPLLSNELIMLKQNLGHSSLDQTAKYLSALGYLMESNIPEQYANELLDDEV